jgi:hypothetical protein
LPKSEFDAEIQAVCPGRLKKNHRLGDILRRTQTVTRAERIAAIDMIEHILTPENDIRRCSSQWNVGDADLRIDPVGGDTGYTLDGGG